MVIPFIIKKIKPIRLLGRKYYRLKLCQTLTKFVIGRILISENLLKRVAHNSHEIQHLEKEKLDLENKLHSFEKETKERLTKMKILLEQNIKNITDKKEKKAHKKKHQQEIKKYKEERKKEHQKLIQEIKELEKKISAILDYKNFEGEYIKIKLGKKEAF